VEELENSHTNTTTHALSMAYKTPARIDFIRATFLPFGRTALNLLPRTPERLNIEVLD
jgi:hypothetical protein